MTVELDPFKYSDTVGGSMHRQAETATCKKKTPKKKKKKKKENEEEEEQKKKKKKNTLLSVPVAGRFILEDRCKSDHFFL